MNEVVIVSGCRTAVGAFGGSLKNTPVVALGAAVMRETLRKVGLRPTASVDMRSVAPGKLKDQGELELERKYAVWDTAAAEISLDEVIMGNVLQAGQGQNPARQAMIQAGIPKETPAFTINKVCGSGLKAIALGAQSIMTGQAEVVLAGGQENMSMVPMALPKARWGYRMELTGVGEVYDLMVFDGLYEIFYGYHMGVTAENIARMYNISREDQDRLAALSHSRALRGIKEGLFQEEIVPIAVRAGKQEVSFAQDERPMETSMEKMAKLKTAFAKDGTVTAGNASGINDGAAAVMVMTAKKAAALGLKPLGRIASFATSGLDPAYMGMGPVPASTKALQRAGWKAADLDLLEINEAFAAQACAVNKEMGWDTSKVNVNGGAIAIGHPIGASGCRILVTLLHEMGKRDAKKGIASLCIGGGMGVALTIER